MPRADLPRSLTVCYKETYIVTLHNFLLLDFSLADGVPDDRACVPRCIITQCSQHTLTSIQFLKLNDELL
eukprot:CAMPEP_0194528920 /NCGR_PEP_ID=MMETSP0253-20130528/65451_1 /TAXON_ID=2966 /ORGANISM="Noctiluca scintillans" /LENGTH=69 /DNA_ID=CAMNT_0039374017 /DNA_START=27 /DNA_END=236 /DNA_ORIENTATION=+